MNIKTRLPFFSAVFVLLLLAAGCATRDDSPPMVARFYVETSPQYPERFSQPITLPESEMTFNVSPEVKFGEWDIRYVQVFDAEFGPAVAFYFESDAARDLRIFSITNQGQRFVLMVNGIPVGAKMINRVIDNGIVTMYLEYPDEDLDELAEGIVKTSQRARDRL